MRIVVPYANDKSDPCVHEAVKLNLALLQLEAEWVRMHEPNDYALLIARLWDEGDPFLIVEHDVILWRGAAEQVWECEHPFCGYDGSLQCTKVEPARLGTCPIDSGTSWYHVDGQMLRRLRARGFDFHDHCPSSPAVINLNRENVPR